MTDDRPIDTIVSSHLAGDDIAEVFAFAEEMATLAQTDGFQRLQGLLTRMGEMNIRFLRDGPLRSQEEYARELGQLSGLAMIADLPEAIQKHARRREQALAETTEEKEAVS